LEHELGQGEFGSVMKGVYTKQEAFKKKVSCVSTTILCNISGVLCVYYNNM